MLTCGFHAGAFVSDTRWSGGGTCGEKHWGVQEDTNWSWARRVHIWGFSCGKKSCYGAESDSGNAQHFLDIHLRLFHKLSHYLHLTIPLLDAKNFSLCGLLLIWGMWDKISTRAWWSHHPHFRGICTHCWFLTKLVIHDHWHNNVICIVICVRVLVVVFISPLYCTKGFLPSGHFLFLSLQETGLLVSLCCAVFCELDRESFVHPHLPHKYWSECWFGLSLQIFVEQLQSVIQGRETSIRYALIWKEFWLSWALIVGVNIDTEGKLHVLILDMSVHPFRADGLELWVTNLLHWQPPGVSASVLRHSLSAAGINMSPTMVSGSYLWEKLPWWASPVLHRVLCSDFNDWA